MLLSTLFFAGMNVCVKQLGRLPTLEVILARSVVSLVLSWWAAQRAGVNVWGDDAATRTGKSTSRWLLASRGVTGALSLVLYFATVQHLPLALAVTLQYLSPIFTALIGIWLLREPVRAAQWACFGVAFGGVMLTQVDHTILPADAEIWLLMGVAGAIVSGFSYVTIRRLRGRAHPLVIVFWFPLIALPLGLIGTVISGLWPTPAEWGWLLLTGIFTQGAQVTMTRAYQAEQVSKVAVLNYIGLLYAVAIGWGIFGEKLSLLTFSGLALVLVGVVANVWVKARHDRQATAALAAETAVMETV
jgi:drug/metabolite transporter (DMT)-like permease